MEVTGSEIVEPAGLLAARQLVEWGARVFPAFVSKNGEKVPLVKGWPDAAVGKREVVEGVGSQTLREWYSRYPYAWAGIACGPDSFLCLDADKESGVERLREFVSSVGVWEGGAMVARTPGRGTGGIHIYWRWPSWLDGSFHSAKVRLEDGGEVDLRGNRCFVLAAGARRGDGVYEILEEPGAEGPVEAPRSLVEAIMAESALAGDGVNSYGGGGMEELSPTEAWELAPLGEGRKNALAGLLWHVAIRGAGEEEVLDWGLRFGREVCEPSLDEEIVRKKAEYTYSRAKKRRDDSAKESQKLMDMMTRQLGI